jgi:hypothetical protein
MLHPESEANSSSERRREPEHTSRAPRHDATTDDQTHRADPLPRRQTREGLAAALPALSPSDALADAKCDGAARLTQRPWGSGLRLAASSSHSSACERAIRAASRVRRATRRSCTASSLRFACSYLSAYASASAALCSSVSATRRNTEADSATRNRVFPTARLAAAPGGSTASESIVPAIIAPGFRPPRSGVRTGNYAIASDLQHPRGERGARPVAQTRAPLVALVAISGPGPSSQSRLASTTPRVPRRASAGR